MGEGRERENEESKNPKKCENVKRTSALLLFPSLTHLLSHSFNFSLSHTHLLPLLSPQHPRHSVGAQAHRAHTLSPLTKYAKHRKHIPSAGVVDPTRLFERYSAPAPAGRDAMSDRTLD